MGVVVDSSIFIAAERGRFDWTGFHGQIASEPLFITVISLAELQHGAERADTSERRAAREQFVSAVEARYPLSRSGATNRGITRSCGPDWPEEENILAPMICSSPRLHTATDIAWRR